MSLGFGKISFYVYQFGFFNLDKLTAILIPIFSLVSTYCTHIATFNLIFPNLHGFAIEFKRLEEIR